MSEDPPHPASVPGRSGHETPAGPRQPRHAVSARTVGLATVWPEILSTVPADQRETAARALQMPMVAARDEDLVEVLHGQTPGAFDFLILEGVVLKQTTLSQHRALELLSAGDLLAPPLTAARQLESRSVSRYLAHGEVSLIAINARFGQTARQWPGIADVLHERLGRQTHRASMHAAMLHFPRVDDRVLALFADLAERFGRVNTAGIVVDLRLTHEIIGGLVGSRRPTVSLALKALAERGAIQRQADHRWLLSRSILTA